MLAVAALILSWPPSGTAQVDSASQREAARGHFEAAERHFVARRFREAIREFQLAQSKLPTAELHFNIARCHEELGEYRQAVEHYEKYLRDKVDAPDADDVAARITGLRELERDRVGSGGRSARPRVRVDGPRAGARVSLDGSLLGTAPLERSFPVDPGRHRLEVTHPGYLPFVADITVPAQEGVTVADVELRAAPRAHGEGVSSLWPYAAGVAAVAALLASGVLVGLASAEESPSNERVYLHLAEYTGAAGVAFGLGSLALFAMDEER